VIPMSVILGQTIYPDGQLGLDQVMARVDEGLSTSGANTGEILQAVEAIEGDVLLLTISRQMSSTNAAAVIAANMVGERVRVLDTCPAAGIQPGRRPRPHRRLVAPVDRPPRPPPRRRPPRRS